jgi:hypothetical protein
MPQIACAAAIRNCRRELTCLKWAGRYLYPMDRDPSGDDAGLWALDELESSDYHEAAPSDELIRSIEAELEYRLPTAYVDLARSHNGGLLRRDAHASSGPTTWADDHVAVTGIFAIGRTAPLSLCGSNGQRLWREEWGYPDLGVYFADTPSAGHDMIALDYRACGPNGEPSIVHVDQEVGYVVTKLASSFGEFISGLVEEEFFPD